MRELLVKDAPASIALITIRSDAYERLQTATALETVPQHTLSLPPLAKGAYLDVIEGPARRLADTPRALKIEPALSNALLADIEAGGAKDALPLLAFTLERLYTEYGAVGTLSLAGYNALGRVKGSIEAAVERALKASDANPAVPRDRAAKLALLRRGLIPWLAGIDPDTNSPRRRVARLSEIPAEARPLVDHLVEARLLSTDTNQAGEVTIEPSHEALLRQWGLLKGWLEEDLGALTTLEGVKRAASDWTANCKRSAWLSHRSGRLEEAEKQTARREFANFLNTDEHAYLAACRTTENAEAWRKRRQNRIITFSAITAAAVLFVLAAVAGWKWIAADRQRQVAQEQTRIIAQQRNDGLLIQSKFLADVAKREAEGGQATDGMLIALAALPDQKSDDEIIRVRPFWAAAEAALEGSRRRRNELAVLPHAEAVAAAQFSPNGRRIVTFSDNNILWLWDAETGEVLGKPIRHDNSIYGIDFSRDGSRLATASADKTARVWDADSGKSIGEPMRHEDAVQSVDFSPDGRRIVTVSGDILQKKGEARLWDAETGKSLGEPMRHGDRIATAAFSPDGQRILTGSWDKTARLWDGETGKPIGAAMIHDDHVLSAHFSPDGRRIVTSSSFVARLWDGKSGAPLGEPLRANGQVYASFSPDGRRVLTVAGEHDVRLWDGETGLPLSETMKEDGKIKEHGFSPDGRRFLTVSERRRRPPEPEDLTARLWDGENGKPLGEVMRGVLSASFSADGRLIVSASMDKTARLWDGETGKPRGEPLRHDGWVTTADFSPDGRRILTASEDKTVRLWDVQDRQILGEPMTHDKRVYRIVFSPDSRRIVTASQDDTVRIWDGQTGEPIGEPMRHGDHIAKVAFSPDGQRILTASDDKTARLWDGQTGKPLGDPMAHNYRVLDAVFSPDGRRIVTVSGETARLWDVETGKPIGELKGHEDYVSSAAFSPDGRRIVTASHDNTARLWDGETGKIPWSADEASGRSLSRLLQPQRPPCPHRR